MNLEGLNLERVNLERVNLERVNLKGVWRGESRIINEEWLNLEEIRGVKGLQLNLVF